MNKDFIDCIKFKDGSYVTSPQFVDYRDGEGVQLDGGLVFDKDGKFIGHIDPPGHRGAMGTIGSNEIAEKTK